MADSEQLYRDNVLTKQETEMDESFQKGEEVLYRSKPDKEYKEGYVTSVQPLKVKGKGNWFSTRYNDVIKKSAGTDEAAGGVAGEQTIDSNDNGDNLKLGSEDLRSTQMIAEQLIEASNAPNAEVVIMRNLEKFSECCMEGAKRATQFFDDVTTIQRLIEEIDDKQLSKLVEERKRKGEHVLELPNKDEDVKICRKAIAVSEKQSKITRETMKVCRDVSLEIGDMKDFFLTINMATKRYKEGDYVECKEWLAELKTKKSPCAEHIAKSLLELQQKWQELKDDMAKLSGSFHDMTNKYNNAKKLFGKKMEDVLSTKNLNKGWTAMFASVSTTVAIIGTIAIATSSTVVGIPAFVAAAGCVVYGAYWAASGIASYRKWSQASQSCDKMSQFHAEQKAKCDEVAKLAQQTAEKLGYTADAIRTNIIFFVGRLEKLARKETSTKNYSRVTPKEGEFSVDDLFKALKKMIEKVEAGGGDFVADIKATVQACKEVEDTVSYLEDELRLLDSDPQMVKKLRALSNFTHLYPRRNRGANQA